MDHPGNSSLVQADINALARKATHDPLPQTAFYDRPDPYYSTWHGTAFETDLEVFAQAGPGGAAIGAISDVMLVLGFTAAGYWRVEGIRCRSSGVWFPLPPALYPLVAEGLANQADRIDDFIADEARALRYERRRRAS